MADSVITIWAPRWHDKVVLISERKVRKGKNKIVFTKVPKFKDKVFILEGDVIKRFPLDSNGVIPCYAVPLGIVEAGEYSG